MRPVSLLLSRDEYQRVSHWLVARVTVVVAWALDSCQVLVVL